MLPVVRAWTTAPTQESNIISLQTSPSTEVTREPNQMISWQDQGPTHLQSSLIPTRPDYRGRRVTARVWSQLFQMLAFLPPTVTANSRRCASVQPNLIMKDVSMDLKQPQGERRSSVGQPIQSFTYCLYIFP